MLKKSFRSLKNQDGLAIFEVIPVIVVIALLINFSLGFFGVVHTGILNSMAARNYAFETFRNRTNLVYFRDTAGSDEKSYATFHSRAHGIASETRPSGNLNSVATTRGIAYAKAQPADQGAADFHEPNDTKSGIFGIIDDGSAFKDDGSSPVWIHPMYGMCLDACCKQGGC